jgi:glycosyltransferase involved in cell wall biosynthesis
MAELGFQFTTINQNNYLINGVEVEIVNDVTDSLPMVSVTMITYNHSKFIKKAIEGVLMQRTNFKIELIIGDDLSSDDTREIIKTYQKLNNETIVLKLPKKNLGMNVNSLSNKLFCKGKYIAECEGDDYWTDPFKLQKQVDFLEKNKDCNYCFTSNSILKLDGVIEKKERKKLPKIFDLNYLLEQKILPSTLTVMFKNDFEKCMMKWNNVLLHGFNGDWILLFILTFNSKIGFISDDTAVYRQGVGVISNTNIVVKMKNGIETNKQLNEITNFKYNKYLNDKRFNFSEISYHYARKKKIIRFLIWFLKIQIHLIKFHGFTSILRNWNKRFIKNSLNIFLNRTK